MESFDLIFITTHQNNQFLPNLIKSIDNHITDLKLLLVVISQECDFKYETNTRRNIDPIRQMVLMMPDDCKWNFRS